MHQALDVCPDVARPVADELLEAFAVAGVQGAARLLVAGQISGHRRKKPASSFRRSPYFLLAWLSLSRLIDEPANGRRSAIRLFLKPLPMPRQQRHFARDHPELWAAGADAGSVGLGTRQDFSERSPKVEIDLAPSLIFEGQNDGIVVPIGAGLHRGQDLVALARRQ